MKLLNDCKSDYVLFQIGAYCYAELGTMITKSGADYAYIMETFGPFMAFIRLWIECMIVRPCSQAIVALTFSTYVMKPFFPDCDPSEDSARMLAVCCILVLTFINCWDVKWATHVQDIFTYAKLLALFLIIGVGAYLLCMGNVKYFTFDNTKTEVTSLALSFYSGLFAYNGWNYLNFIIEELQDPVKNLPRAIAISCTLVTVVYVFANISFYTILSPDEVLGSSAVAVTFAERAFGMFAWTISVFVALSTFGAVNGILLTSSRLFYAGACEGEMPEILTMIQIQRFTPTPAVLAMALLSMLYLTVSDIFALINYVGFATWVPIRVPLVFSIVYLLASLFVTIVPMYASPVETGYGILMILSSIPVYVVCIAWKNKPKWFRHGMLALTRFLQKMLMVLGKTKSTQVFSKRFELPLLIQSIVMNLTMFLMIHLCVKVRRNNAIMKTRDRVFADFDTRYFWAWTDFQSYPDFMLIFWAAGAAVTYLLLNIEWFMETVGFLAVFTEAMLGSPQFLRNLKNKSTTGMSMSMVVMWTLGDMFKTVYFVARNAPMQFWICGTLQVTLDVAILLQVYIYRKNPAPRTVHRGD